MFVFGTRPEAIKLAPIIIKSKLISKFKVITCATSQHRQMLDEVLDIFNIKPDYDLNIMKDNQDLFDITANILTKIKTIINHEKPDIIIVQGDTTTCFISALSAYYLGIKIAHVEAGLRTYDKYSPFPEEVNRVLTTHIADLHFAPTENSRQNLIRENINSNNITMTGNPVIDALFYIKEKIKNNSLIYKDFYHIDLSKRIVLITSHRRENFGKGLENICESIKELAYINKEVLFIYPVHLNPNVKKPVFKLLSNINNVILMKPLPYLSFVALMLKSYLILTDSGGIQEEAPSLGIPVLVMRDTTERTEAIDAGTVKLVGTNKNNIINQTQALLDDYNLYKEMSEAKNPYGDGKASDRIIQDIIKWLKL